MSFEKYIKETLKHEGGYVDHPTDPGGETNYGISKRAYPDLDIKNLTEEDAIEIYKNDYWNKIKGDYFPDPLAFCLFDFTVNSGPTRPTKVLQKLTGVKIDGVIGPKTIEAACKTYAEDNVSLIERFQEERLRFLKKLKIWPIFGKGWERRVLSVKAHALANVHVKLDK